MYKLPLVDDWHPEEEDRVLQVTGKMVRVDFNKVIDTPIDENFKLFIVEKKSYYKWMGDTIAKKDADGKEIILPISGGCKYINYFMKYYDHDNELLYAYLKMKVLIDDKDNRMKKKAMQQALYSIVMTPSMIAKIKKMTEDNWILDLTPDPTKKFPESLKFENSHAKILMNISIAIKIILPIVTHYLVVAKYYDDQVNHIIPFYLPMFNIFGESIDIYNKLWITVVSKVNRSFSEDETIWDKHEVYGEEKYSYMMTLLHENLIRDSIFRYVFNQSPISFNSAVIEQQFMYMMKTNFLVNLVNVDNSVSNTSNVEGLSGIDKIELHSYKVDEGNVILAELNVTENIKRLRKKIKYKDFDEAVSYYKEHHRISDIHLQIINIYASTVGCRDLTTLNRTQYIQMMTIIKRMLQMRGFIYLPQILSANATINKRIIRNKRFINSIESSSAYDKIIRDKFSALVELGKDNLIINMMSTVVSSSYVIVDYDNPGALGRELEINSNELLSEFLQYLSLS